MFDADLNFSLDTLQARQRKLPKNDVVQVFNHIWEGGMPQVQGVDDELLQEYFNSYIETYLMRDVAESSGITDTVRFRKFLVGCDVIERFNKQDIRELCPTISDSSIEGALRKLVATGELKKEGHGKNTCYFRLN